MEKIVSLCKRRGFVYPGSEIYGGLANTYDYGPLGVELKKNIKNLWWKYFIHDKGDMVGLDGGIISSQRIWQASGHVQNFKDPLVECKKCHKRFRPDKLKDSSKCPECGGEFTVEKQFSLLFKAMIGPVEGDQTLAYLRGETAQNIFINFKNILQSTNVKIPFGIGQMGKAFRNEITTGNFIFRTIEFEQMEIEYFISPKADWNKIFDQWVDYIHNFMDIIGLDKKMMHDEEIPEKERAFYSKRTIDMEYDFPFGQDELWAIAYRTDYDLKQHQQHAEEDLRYFDTETKEKYIPHVIEPTFGVDRTILAILTTAYKEEDVNGEKRVVLKLHPNVAPYKIAVFPLLRNKPDIVKKANEVHDNLKDKFNVFWDDRGNIGKRYRYQDEIGTPYCVTVDFETLEKDNSVTVRDRDSMKQERVPIEKLKDYFNSKLN
ncbi:MAG: glycine--tRNA ligase [Candidatus Buchananbacteria bacterium]|nr:glycine--tRNA ligase [Candidatus Buchananbacteria bacterium]